VIWYPAANSGDAPTNPIIRVTFDDYPDPDTADGAGLSLSTAVYGIAGTYSVDLIGRAVNMRPWANLISEVGYMLRVHPALQSLGGCPGTESQRQFRTGTTRVAVPAPPAAAMAEVQAIFDAHCAAGCHAQPDGGCLTAPFGGLSLCATEARGALLDVPSRQQSDLRLVAAADSARSYLVRKLLPPAPTGAVAPAFGHRGEGVSEDELRLLQAWIDRGAPP
jgi:hypothetical protein